MRAVLDVNVLISAVLSPRGTPAQLVRAWLHGAFDVVVSEHLLTELARALAYPKLRNRIPPADAEAYVELLRRTAIALPDPTTPPPARAKDPDDDYLLALARDAGAALVSGARHLLALRGDLPVFSPGEFAARVAD